MYNILEIIKDSLQGAIAYPQKNAPPTWNIEDDDCVTALFLGGEGAKVKVSIKIQKNKNVSIVVVIDEGVPHKWLFYSRGWLSLVSNAINILELDKEINI